MRSVGAIEGGSLANGRLPERTNGAASKAVVALRVTKGSNPLSSATKTLIRYGFDRSRTGQGLSRLGLRKGTITLW